MDKNSNNNGTPDEEKRAQEGSENSENNEELNAQTPAEGEKTETQTDENTPGNGESAYDGHMTWLARALLAQDRQPIAAALDMDRGFLLDLRQIAVIATAKLYQQTVIGKFDNGFHNALRFFRGGSARLCPISFSFLKLQG